MKFKPSQAALDFYNRSLGHFLVRLRDDESGQATVEYILILTVVIVAASAIARTVLSTLDQGILTFGGQLEKDLHTGKATLNAWSN